jgi:hypothetical protein
VNAANLAEVMFCDLRFELIGSQLRLATEQAEILGPHAQMQDPFLAADGAVALGHTANDSFDLEADCATMATS